MVSIVKYAQTAICLPEIDRPIIKAAALVTSAVSLCLQPKFTLPILLGAVLMQAPKYYYKYVEAHKKELQVTTLLAIMKKTGIERQTVTTLSIRKLCKEVDAVLIDRSQIESVQTLFSHLFKGRLAHFTSLRTEGGVDLELFMYSPAEWRFPCSQMGLYIPNKVFVRLSQDGKITFQKSEQAPYEEPIMRRIAKKRYIWQEIICKEALYEISDSQNKKRYMSDLLFSQLLR